MSMEVIVTTWNNKQPVISDCFNWMILNLYIFYIENCCFTKHSFINGCLGFQVVSKLAYFIYLGYVFTTYSYRGVSKYQQDIPVLVLNGVITTPLNGRLFFLRCFHPYFLEIMELFHPYL